MYLRALSSLALGVVLYAAPPASPPPEAPARPTFTPMQRKWWSLQPLGSATGTIDSFIDAKLAEKGLKANPRADKVTLLRRASLLVTGLPPTPEETQAFLADESAGAFEKVVDRLLASPRYGERWARHWLDLARYADSDGFKSDETRPNIWRYRDYVIRSFNADKPYNRFVAEQIAGDELYPGDVEALVATGFQRHFPDESNAANIMLRRQELLNDITDTTASVFLGLTYGCARCHDHKFDPILHKDYYRLQAFFANTRIDDEVSLQPAGERAGWQERQKAWETATAPIREKMEALLKAPREAFYKDRFYRFPEEIQQVIAMAPAERTPYQWQMYLKAKPQVTFTDAEIAAKLKGEAAAEYKRLAAQLAGFDALRPAAIPRAQTMVDYGAQAPETFVLKGGNYDNPTAKVAPGFLSILDPSDAVIAAPADGRSTGRRAALARWLTDPANPLTARVMVNRIWHYQFGTGLAGTPSDLGLMGERPTNLPLLDALTRSFIAGGWSIKKLQREILLSAAWQRSSAFNAEAAQVDAADKYLWRFPRRRLEGEAIRDAMLATAGRLNGELYGPPVFPPLPAGVETRGGWKKQESAEAADRRSVYVFIRRNTRYPMFEAFDMPDTHESCARRNVTVSPAQSLELMNSVLIQDWSRSFAARVRNDSGLDMDAQVDRAWKLAYSRAPRPAEREAAREFLRRQMALAGGEESAVADLCQTLLASNEFLYVN